MRRIDVVDFKGKVRNWLNSKDIQLCSNNPELYVIETLGEGEALSDPRIKDVLAKVRLGCDALFLGLPLLSLSANDIKLQALRDKGVDICWCSPTSFEQEAFDFQIDYYESKPRFVGPYHYLKNHTVFEGLYPGHVVDDRFGNVMPENSLKIDGARVLSGSVGTPPGYHFRVKGCPRAKNLRFGADLCVVNYGKGHLIFSTYRIEENLRKDPLADRLLTNILSEMF